MSMVTQTVCRTENIPINHMEVQFYAPITLGDCRVRFHLYELRCEELEVSKKFKMKIYVSSGIRTSNLGHRKLVP